MNKNEQKKEWQKALEFRASGEWIKVRDILETLQTYMNSMHGFLIILGQAYWELEQLDDASKTFRKATMIDPVSAIASESLFHTLWDKGFEDDAFEEWKRFVSVGGKSEIYDELLSDLRRSFKENSE